jgi:hypothetical protein
MDEVLVDANAMRLIVIRVEMQYFIRIIVKI